MGEVLEPLGVSAAVVVEGVHAPALGHDPVQVDVGDGGARALWEALTLPQQVAAFVDEGLPVPGQVGGRFALAGGGIEVGHMSSQISTNRFRPGTSGTGTICREEIHASRSPTRTCSWTQSSAAANQRCSWNSRYVARFCLAVMATISPRWMVIAQLYRRLR